MKKFRTIFEYTIPVLAGYIFLGIAFGLLVRTSGFPIWYAVVMSLIVFSGAAEFAAIPLLGSPFDPIGSFVLCFMISARHLFYGIPMLKKYQNTFPFKPFLVFGLSDETFSILSTVDVPENIRPRTFYFLVTFLNFSYWNVGTFLGALCGDFVGDRATGLDFALTALFIVLFLENLKSKTGIISGFMGLIVTFIVLIIAGSGNMVIISMILILVLLLGGRRVIEHE